MKWLMTFGLLAAASLSIAGCDKLAGEKVTVEIVDVEAANFVDGIATQCLVDGKVTNDTKYHVSDVTIDIGDTRFNTGALPANAQTKGKTLFSLNMDEGDTSCVGLAQALMKNASSASVLDCSMTGVAEGDCQKMIFVESTLDEQKIDALRIVEKNALAADRLTKHLQSIPFDKSMEELFRAHATDDQIADFIIRTDALSWFSNRYDQNSAHVAAEPVRDATGTRFRADYTYNNGSAGWVNVTLYSGNTKLPCVEFWDFPGQCRELHVPDEMKLPEMPAPPPVVDQAPVPPDAAGVTDGTDTPDAPQTADPAPVPSGAQSPDQ